ncbi:MAG: hypothetical protein IPN22_05950 [Bacteroidetes bacterium]|nr:hypothetical protein [Bacteroidota bacterium]
MAVYYTSTGDKDVIVNGVTYSNFIKIKGTRNLPVIDTITNPICVGQNINLSTPSTGTAYEWAISNNNFASNVYTSSSQNPGLVNTSSYSAGTYKVRLRVKEDCCGWSIPKYSQFIITTPTGPAQPITGPTVACQGSTKTYSTTAALNATSYNWTVPLGAIINSGQGTLSISVTFSTAGGNVTVSPVGCTSGTSSSLGVTVNQAPSATINGSLTVCSGSGTTLIGGASGGTGGNGVFSYNWSGPSFSSTNQTINVSTGGVYNLTVTDQGSNCTGLTSGTLILNTPAVVVEGADFAVCQSATPVAVALSGASVSGGATTGAWSIISGGGSLSSVLQTSNPELVTYTPDVNYSGTVILRLTTNDPAGPCPAEFADRVITVDTRPTVDAGPDITRCDNTPLADILMTGATAGGTFGSTQWVGGIGLGVWTQNINPAAAYFSPNVIGNSLNLTLRVFGSGGCTGVNVTDTRLMRWGQTPTVDAGPNLSLCNNASVIDITGASSSGSHGALNWVYNSIGGTASITNGAGSITPELTPSSAAGNGTMTITATGIHGCIGIDPTDVMSVSWGSDPSVNAGPDQTSCSAYPVVVNGSAISYSSITWTSSGTGTFSDATIEDPLYYPSSSDITNGSVVLTLTVSAITPCVGTSSDNVTVTFNNTCVNVWLGNSIDWHDPGNWSLSAVPNSCAADVQIPVTANDPTVFVPVSVGNIQVFNNVTVNLHDDILVCKNLTMGGSNSIVSVGIATPKYVRMVGNSNQTILGTGNIENLAVENSGTTPNNTVSLTNLANIGIYRQLRLTSGKLSNVSGGVVTLLSDAARTAILNDFCGTCTGTYDGPITAQRYISNGVVNDQHYISSPVNTPSFGDIGVPLLGADDVFVTPSANCDEDFLAQGSNYGNIFEWVENVPDVSCLLSGWKVQSSGTMDNGKGYSVYLQSGSTIDLTGTPNTGNKTIGGLTNTGYPTGNIESWVVEPGWNLIGNPFASGLWLNTPHPDVDPTIHVWHTSGTYTGTYQPATIGSISATAHLAPFQAFMVRVTNPGTTSFTFQQSEREEQENPFFMQMGGSTLQIDVTGNGFSDVTYVNYQPISTNGYDMGLDADKIRSRAHQPTIYTLMNANDTKRMAINSFSDVVASPTVPLGLMPGDDGNFTFTASGLNSFDPTVLVYLEDKKTNAAWQNFRHIPSYSFTQVDTEEHNRFVLHFTPPAEISTINSTCNGDGAISIIQPGIANWNYAITDAQYNIVGSGVLNSTTAVNVNQLEAGVYTLTLTDNMGYVVVKKYHGRWCQYN